MAKAKSSPRAVLLVDCYAGKIGTVVEGTEDEIAALVANGVADSNEAAIAHAEKQAEG